SKEVTKANTAHETTPGRMSGSVTWRKAARGLAPRLAAARTRVGSKPWSVALTVTTTNGTASTVWAMTRPVKLASRPKEASEKYMTSATITTGTTKGEISTATTSAFSGKRARWSP